MRLLPGRIYNKRRVKILPPSDSEKRLQTEMALNMTEPLSLMEPLRELFVNRADCYCIQHSQGYSRTEKPLTDEVLLQHLKGEITVGSYQLNEESLVKWLCFDLDPEKLQHPEAVARHILKTLFEKQKNEESEGQPRVWPQSVVLEASRYPDPSYHIWILFLAPVAAKVAQWLGLRIIEIANLNPKQIEVFPKQTQVSKERPFGNFVKLPFGKHQVEGKWSRVLNFETFEPVPYSRVLDAFGLSFGEKDLEKIENFEAKSSVQTSFNLPEKFKPLSDMEEERAVQFLMKYWKVGARNQLEMYFLGLCIKKGVSYESTKRIIAEVAARTHDSEAESRLGLVDYHYKTRLSGPLKGSSGIREIIEEVQ